MYESYGQYWRAKAKLVSMWRLFDGLDIRPYHTRTQLVGDVGSWYGQLWCRKDPIPSYHAQGKADIAGWQPGRPTAP